MDAVAWKFLGLNIKNMSFLGFGKHGTFALE